MQKNIQHRWFYPHPKEVLWEYLTKSELLAEWLMENDFKPEVGHKFMFTTKPKIKVGFDGNIYCEVLEIIPFQKLSYSWKGGPGKGKITLDSIVTWTLTPKDNGTELQLDHTGFKGMKNYITYLIMNKGWGSKKLLAKLDPVKLS
jgi:uncharacterized protein YndB with AHSA1/START domain